MNELLTGVGIIREAGAVEAGIDLDRLLLIAGVIIAALVKLGPIIWPKLETYVVGPYIARPLAAIVDLIARYRS